MNKRIKKRGFTLIELIIVIAIIAILAAISIPKFGEVRKNAALKSDIANAKTIANAVTTLIAEEELGLDVATFTINNKADDNGTEEQNKPELLVENYLQNPPKPESNDPANKTKFTGYLVTIDGGNVKVEMGTYELFPNPISIEGLVKLKEESN